MPLVPKKKPKQPKQTDPFDGNPLWAQSQKVVGALTTPLLDHLFKQRQMEEQRIQQQNQASLQRALQANSAAQPNMRDIYNRATQATSAVESALGRANQGQAAQAGSGLTSALAQINDPRAAQLTQNLAQTYQGAGAAGFALGGTDLNRLTQRGAAEEAYLAKQPSILSAMAAGSLQEALAGIRDDYSERESEIQAGIPQQVFAQFQNLQEQQAQAQQVIENRMQKAMDRQAKEKLAVMALNQGLKRDILIKKLDQKHAIERERLDAENQVILENIRSQNDLTQIGARGDVQAGLKGIPTYKDLNPPKPKPGAKKENWTTPGSAKHNRVVEAVEASLYSTLPARKGDSGWLPESQTIKSSLIGATQGETALRIVKAINNVLRKQGVKNLNSPAAIQVRRSYLMQAGLEPENIGRLGNPYFPTRRETPKRTG